ncbi:MAG: hypothetical protein L0G71_07450 [Yaniella sp.]|nr:hypothetical protein [Yaniella sp.]
MRNHLALIVAGVLVFTGCAEPREQSSVDVTPPPEVEVPAQTLYHQAISVAMDDDAIISTGVPAVNTLQSADDSLAQYDPEPAECAGTVDPQYYTTNDLVVGFSSQSGENTMQPRPLLLPHSTPPKMPRTTSTHAPRLGGTAIPLISPSMTRTF